MVEVESWQKNNEMSCLQFSLDQSIEALHNLTR